MKLGLASASNAAALVALLSISTSEVLALPMAAPGAAATAPVVTEQVRCVCGVRRHRSRRVYVEPAVPYPYAVYPAPPVGLTARKILGLGFF